MTTAALPKAAPPVVEEADAFPLSRTLFVDIRPILESVAGLLADDEIDSCFERLDRANEERGFYLELTCCGELAINPMSNFDSAKAEAELSTDLNWWARRHGGCAVGAGAIARLPDGSRPRPYAAWLSAEQMAEHPPIAEGGAIGFCPAFVAEIVSSTDRLSPLRDKMRRYIANGARLGWLIDPYRRQVHIYRPDAEPEILEYPETVSGEPVMPGFAFEVRRRIFDLRLSAETDATDAAAP